MQAGLVVAQTAPPISVSHGDVSMAPEVILKPPTDDEGGLKKGKYFGGTEHDMNVVSTKVLANVQRRNMWIVTGMKTSWYVLVLHLLLL